MEKKSLYAGIGVISLCLFGTLFLAGSAIGTGIDTPIDVENGFEGELVGYGEDQEQHSHLIEIEGELEFSGETANDVEILISPNQETVLDQSTVSVFTEGDRDISFDTTNHDSSVQQSANDEIQPGTTIQIDFQTVFVGGVSDDEITAATVEVEHRTDGGTWGEDSFDVTVDTTTSADNRISGLESDISDLENWRLIGIGGAAVAVIMTLVAAVIFLRFRNNSRPNGRPGTGGPPPN